MKNQVRDDVKLREKKELVTRLRLIFIALVVLALFGVDVYKFYSLQLQQQHFLTQKSDKGRAGNMRIGAGGEAELDGHRGFIYDRHGFELAISIETPSIAAYPQKIPENKKDQLASDLARILELDRAAVREKLNAKHFVWIARKTTPEKGVAVKNLHFPPNQIEIKKESKRYYPGKTLAGQIIGFAGLDNAGLEGLEAAYDSQLRGGFIKLQGIRDSQQRIILTSETPRLNELEGSSLVLTIDQYIQEVCETAIERVGRQFKAKSSSAIVMDPHTGEILAMANWPRFDPNRFNDYTKEDMKNRTVLDAYEPGSMMKVFTYAAAIDGSDRPLSPNTPIDQFHGAFKIGNHTIHDTHTIQNMTAETVVSESSNIGAYQLAKRIGREKFYHYLRRFGFGKKTGINIAGESAGILSSNYTKWPEIQFSNIAFGQGISVSPIQLATATAAIANDGIKLKPWLISEIRDKNGKVIEKGQPERQERIISEKTARQVKQAMERVVTEGTGTRAWVDGYRVGGKTGTAQKMDPRTRAYGNKYMSNFVGIAPIDNPDIVVLVMVDEANIHSGGVVAGPAFSEIVSKVLPYRGIYPKPVMNGLTDPLETMKIAQLGPQIVNPPSNGNAAPAHDAQTPAPANDPAELPPEDAALIAELEPQSPETPTEPPTHDPWQNAGCLDNIKIPDFRGLTAHAAIKLATASCLDVELENAGFVTSQWPSAGATVAPHTRLKLTLKGKYKSLN